MFVNQFCCEELSAIDLLLAHSKFDVAAAFCNSIASNDVTHSHLYFLWPDFHNFPYDIQNLTCKNMIYTHGTSFFPIFYLF